MSEKKPSLVEAITRPTRALMKLLEEKGILTEEEFLKKWEEIENEEENKRKEE